MAGNVKVGGNVIATHTGVEGAGTVTLSNVTASALKMSSSGNTITDSAGNAVLSESSGTVNINKGTVGSSVVFPAGHIIQVVNYTEAASFEQTLDNNLETLTNGTTNFGVNITPKVTGSKTLIMVTIGFCHGHNNGSAAYAVGARLRRDSTDIKISTSNVSSSGRYPQMTMRLESYAADYGRSSTYTILDDTANTAGTQVAYTLAVQRQVSSGTYTLTFNEPHTFSSDSNNMDGHKSSTTSHFIAMEIAQ